MAEHRHRRPNNKIKNSTAPTEPSPCCAERTAVSSTPQEDLPTAHQINQKQWKKSIFSPSNQSKIFHRIRHLRTIPPPTTKFSNCQARHNRFNFPASPPTSKIVRLVSGKHSSLCGKEFRMPDRSNHNNYELSQEQSSTSKGESAFPRVDNARETKEREGGESTTTMQM